MYSRYQYPYNRRYSSSYYPYRAGRGTVGRGKAAMSSAKSAKKSSECIVNVNGLIAFTYPANSYRSNVEVICPFYGATDVNGLALEVAGAPHGGALNDRIFRLYCSQYDEFRLTGVKVTMNPALPPDVSFATGSPLICTMWDRKANPMECGLPSAGTHSVYGRKPNAEEIINTEGCMKSFVTTTSTKVFYRSCFASTLQEKSNFIDSTIAYNTTVGVSPLTSMSIDQWTKTNLSFSPALFVCMCKSTSQAADSYWNMAYSVEYQFVFRNPKSELSSFITVENPAYVNPAGRSSEEEENASNVYYRYVRAIQDSQKIATGQVSPGDKVKKEGDSDDVMDVEDDPGTA